MKKFNKSILFRIIADCLITTILLIVAFNFFKIFKSHVKRGFFCDDKSLKYPYQPSTVDRQTVLVLSLYAPAVLITVGEILLYLLERKRTATAGAEAHGGIAKAFLKLHYNLTTFLCGLALHACFVHTTKIVLGRLRPHFFDVCQPYRLLDGSTCDNPKNHGIYIQDYECNANNVPYISKAMIKGVHQSFPSGHASFIFYGMIFIILYLQRVSKILRQNHRINFGLFMMVVQVFCALLAWFVAVSRVTDNEHHWSDVLVGIVLGTSVAIAATLYVCQQLKSVNSCRPEGVKSSNPEATSTTTFATTTPNAILVP